MGTTNNPSTPPASPRRGLNAFRSALDGAGANVLPAGTRVGDCEIVGLIGQSSFSIVYLAYDYALERNVALKEYMPASLAARDSSGQVTLRAQADEITFNTALDSFISEARLLTRFDAPALVKIFRFWEANGTAYMAMPFYEGVTLNEALITGRIDVGEQAIKTLLDQLLDALDILHAAHCHHPDIAPDNILLLADGRPVLLDFGAARRVISAHAQTPAAALRPGFAPVEEYDDIPNLKPGPWTDVYAMAAVVYFLITGKPPAPAPARMVSDAMLPARQAGAGRYSDSFLAALDQALAVMPQNRTQSVARLRHALGMKDNASDMSTIRSPETRRGPMMSAPPGNGRTRVETWLSGVRARPASAAAALVALVLAISAGFWGVQRPDPAAADAQAGSQATVVLGKTDGVLADTAKPAPGTVQSADPALAGSNEEARWRLASSLNNAAAYQSYLGEYPDGRHAATARGTLERLRAGANEPPPSVADPAMLEESLWNAVRSIDKPLVYESFLGKYPNGRHAPAARASLARLKAVPKEPRSPAESSPRETASRKPDTGSMDARRVDRPLPAAIAPTPSAPAPVLENSTPPARDKVATVKPPEPTTAPGRMPPETASAADAETEQESMPPPAPGRDRRTLRLPNQIMTGDFAPDPVTGLVSGRGQIVWDNGDQFDGTMVRGLKEGKGEFRWANGQRYKGDWSRDQPHGRGSIVYPNGDRYTGDMRGGLPNGAGTLTFRNGSRYQGEVRDGLPNGTGTLAFANGNRYRGEVRDGMPHGAGINRFSNGDAYSGAWRRGLSNGQGRYTWANGDYWEGEFRDDVKTDNGKMEFAAGQGQRQDRESGAR